MNPYFERDGVIVYHGDCLDVLRTLPDESIDAVVTDPPYALPGGFMGKNWDIYDGREDAGFAYWLSGLIDGEGHFAIKQHARGTHAPFFQLKMRADERGTLEMIQRKLKIGRLSDEDHEPNPMSRWTVDTKHDCQRLVDLLDKYPPRAKKRIDYATWREAVCEWTDRPRGNRWSGPADNTHMAELRDRLTAGRHYVEPPWSGHEFQDWCRLWATECFRVLKPGGHMASFGGTRTYHRLTAGIEDAGFEIRDGLMWIYSQGFPKSRDISKAIDTEAGVVRAVTRAETRPAVPGETISFDQRPSGERARADIPITPEAWRWQGWGTALKPGWEPIVLARKPFPGTVAQNALTHGTGGLNLVAAQVPMSDADRANWTDMRDSFARRDERLGSATKVADIYGVYGSHGDGEAPAGRWPPNVLFTHSPDCVEGGDCGPDCPVAELDRQSGFSRSVDRGVRGKGGIWRPSEDGIPAGPTYDDEGGASRFFPRFRYESKAPARERPADGSVFHPTVKPLALMTWLTALLTPPGGTVLDLFAGSGTTGRAAQLQGFTAVLVERDDTYLPLIVNRLRGRRREMTGAPRVRRATDQGDLFADDLDAVDPLTDDPEEHSA